MQHLKTMATDHPGRIALPTEIVARLGLAPGDWVQTIETSEGLLIKPADETFQRQMAIAEQVMEEGQDALRRLAQS
jgi:bifunctional DNA-binding transcriptional regulator/antitoxin component of YhaV-PrlF toxin-antitoxin module